MGTRQKQAAVANAAEMVIQRLEERRMLSVTLDEDGIWTIRPEGDQGHSIVIDVSPANPDRLRVQIDGKTAGSAAIADILYVDVYGGVGDDSIKLNVNDPEVSFFVAGGAGNDTIVGGAGDDDLDGGRGYDSISGGEGDDNIFGGGGLDDLDGGGGDDWVSGGRGSDEITGSDGNDEIIGGWGNDDLDGDAGDDEIEGGRGGDDLNGGDGSDELMGGSGGDELIGGSGDDEMDGRDGADTLAGGLGEDSLRGGRGSDQEHGGFDDDEVLGQAGDDTMWGGEGIDTLKGGRDSDTIYNEDGVDQIPWDQWDVSRNDQLVNPLKRVDDETGLKAWLIERALKNYGWMLGSKTYRTWYEGDAPYTYRYYGNVYYYEDRFTTMAVDLNVSSRAMTFTSLSSQVSDSVRNIDFSTTNTQEEGVDEADLVKTDGEYLYLISDGKVKIIDAWPADESSVVATINVNGNAQGLYLNGDRLTVVSQSSRSTPTQETDDAKEAAWFGFNYQSVVKVSVYDLSDPLHPTLAEETDINGNLTTSREVDGRLYLVVQNHPTLPRPIRFKVGEALKLAEGRYWPDRQQSIWGGVKFTLEEGAEEKVLEWEEWSQAYQYETLEQYRARLEGMTLNELLPGYTVTAGESETSGGLAGQIYVPDDDKGYINQMSSVVLVNLNDDQPGPTASTTIFGMEGQVYASTDSLYVSKQVWETPMGSWQGEQRTDLYKFELGEDSVDLEATGEVPGFMLNSFSMDEEGDYFRIATTSSNGSSNNVFVMAEDGERLEVVGGITGLAISERIFAARFIGDKGYLVTFRQIDPLFTLDLSDPLDPKVAGELKIPGFSSYLHPIDDQHLLAIGRDGNNLQVSLFDVSDMGHPMRSAVYTISNGWGASSQAEHDHHAFAYFPEQHVLALPVWSWNDGAFTTVLLDIDLEHGISQLGVINQVGLGPHRTVRIGEFVYAIGRNRVKVVSLLDPDEVVADVDLDPPAVNEPVGVANIMG